MKKKNLKLSKKESKPEMEECICCGAETNEPKDKHIDFRYNYIEGAGQLCSKCAEKYE